MTIDVIKLHWFIIKHRDNCHTCIKGWFRDLIRRMYRRELRSYHQTLVSLLQKLLQFSPISYLNTNGRQRPQNSRWSQSILAVFFVACQTTIKKSILSTSWRGKPMPRNGKIISVKEVFKFWNFCCNVSIWHCFLVALSEWDPRREGKRLVWVN